MRDSMIESVTLKPGRQGSLLFVTVKHAIHAGTDAISVSEEQDIVYRGPGGAEPAREGAIPAPPDAQWTREVFPDATLLFRYSALTFNAHRIHYDRAYARDVEGYPGLVVHGPLVATMLMELLHTHLPSTPVRSFCFRSVAPLFDTAQFRLCGCPDKDARTVALWAETVDKKLAMSASVELDTGIDS